MIVLMAIVSVMQSQGISHVRSIGKVQTAWTGNLLVMILLEVPFLPM